MIFWEYVYEFDEQIKDSLECAEENIPELRKKE